MTEAAQTQDYQDELGVAVDLARNAGSAILEFYNRPIEVLQKFDENAREPVTLADRIANELIVAGLHRRFPDDGILAEESEDTDRRLGKRRVWMVDPLDGTNGFIDGNGDFAVQIGLSVDGKAVLGVVYQPLTELLYRAVRGLGTWIESPDSDLIEARVSEHTSLAQMRLAASRSHRSPRMDRVVRALGVQHEVQRGSVGIKVGLIIEQQCDIYVHLSPRTKQWDTCAPQIILTEAGGTFSDLFGNAITYNAADVQHRNGLVATNGAAHEQVISTLGPLLAEFGRLPA
ncbi:MAG TPA: 3'(2'),5'-bisphosphate nucleotidase CysQ [Pyrinomonadaceae bacterium]|nr:3'(2'),5'-bisphosphate nucleotidase CysQ [Pyrinomonadaceae bacterium]